MALISFNKHLMGITNILMALSVQFSSLSFAGLWRQRRYSRLQLHHINFANKRLHFLFRAFSSFLTLIRTQIIGTKDSCYAVRHTPIEASINNNIFFFKKQKIFIKSWHKVKEGDSLELHFDDLQGKKLLSAILKSTCNSSWTTFSILVLWDWGKRDRDERDITGMKC